MISARPGALLLADARRNAICQSAECAPERVHVWWVIRDAHDGVDEFEDVAIAVRRASLGPPHGRAAIFETYFDGARE